MPTISGQIVAKETGNGIDGLVVAAFAQVVWPFALSDVDLPDADYLLGSASTSGGGGFSINASASQLPNIQLSVFSPYKRVILSALQPRSAGDIHWPKISLSQNQVEGWLATQGSDSPVRLSQGNHIEFFPDNVTAWAALVGAVEKATTSVQLIQYYWDITNTFERFNPTMPPIGQPTKADRLELLLVVRNRNGLPVRSVISPS